MQNLRLTEFATVPEFTQLISDRAGTRTTGLNLSKAHMGEFLEADHDKNSFSSTTQKCISSDKKKDSGTKRVDWAT